MGLYQDLYPIVNLGLPMVRTRSAERGHHSLPLAEGFDVAEPWNRAFCHSAKLPLSDHLRRMQNAPFNIVISGKRYECRVSGDTEGEAADTAELIMHQLRQQDRIWPVRVNIECRDLEAAKRLAAYFAAITVKPDLG